MTYFSFFVIAVIFIPYYTGSVINSIAIERSTSKATLAIVFMGLLSLGRWVPLIQITINLNFIFMVRILLFHSDMEKKRQFGFI